MNMQLSFSNTGDQIIQVEIPKINFSKYVSLSGSEEVILEIGATYYITLRKGGIPKYLK